MDRSAGERGTAGPQERQQGRHVWLSRCQRWILAADRAAAGSEGRSAQHAFEGCQAR